VLAIRPPAPTLIVNDFRSVRRRRARRRPGLTVAPHYLVEEHLAAAGSPCCTGLRSPS